MIYILENYFREILAYALQTCQIANCFSNTSELTKLHDLAIFLGEDALNSLTKFIVAKLLFLFLYLYNNIICEIFSNVFFLVIMLVCLRIGAYVHTGQKIPATNLVYIPG